MSSEQRFLYGAFFFLSFLSACLPLHVHVFSLFALSILLPVLRACLRCLHRTSQEPGKITEKQNCTPSSEPCVLLVLLFSLLSCVSC